MDEVKKLLEEKTEILKKIVLKAEENNRKEPKGKLVVNKNGNVYQYYIRTDPKDTHGKYISKKYNLQLIRQLAQQEYASKVLPQAKEQLQTIESFLSNYDDKVILQIYTKLHPAKKRMIVPYVLTDEQYIEAWENSNIQKCNKEKEEKMQIKLENEEDGIYTEKGEIVQIGRAHV